MLATTEAKAGKRARQFIGGPLTLLSSANRIGLKIYRSVLRSGQYPLALKAEGGTKCDRHVHAVQVVAAVSFSIALVLPP